MNIVVCIKQVPGTNKVEVDPVTGVLKREGVDSKTNPYDLYALETALQLKENHGGEVSVLSMGPLHARTTVMESYSMGADKGYLISDRRFVGSDVLATSHAMAQALKKFENLDLILCGKQTTDGDTAQVGPEMAEELGIPSISNVQKIREIDRDSIIIEMDLGNNLAVIKVKLPCLLMVEKAICQPRLPSYIKRLAAIEKDVTIFTLESMGDPDETHYGLNGSPTKVKRIFAPDSKQSHVIWKDTNEVMTSLMLEKLKELKLIEKGV